MKLWHRLTAWLSDLWLGFRVWWHTDTASMRDDQEPFYRPIYRGQPFAASTPRPPSPPPPPEPTLSSRYGHPIRPAHAHCVNCGHCGSVLLPDGPNPPDLENEILDMLQCPVCGLYTMCSY